MKAVYYEHFQGKLKPGLPVGKTISLEEAPEALVNMDKFENTGVIVINQF